MAKLYLMGVNKPITIKSETAKNIGRIKDSEFIEGDRDFNIEGLRFKKRDIRYVMEYDFEDASVEESDERRKENEKYYEEVSQDYKKYIVMLCKRPLKEKVNDTHIYELVWSAFTFSPMPEEFLVEVKKRQKDFFEVDEKHLKYPYASINILDLLPKDKFEEYHISEIFPSYMSSKVQDIIGVAYREASSLKLI